MTSDTSETAAPASTPTSAEKGRWRLSCADAADLLMCLPQMDRVMTALRIDGILHERLGQISAVTRTDAGDIVIADADGNPSVTLPDALLQEVVLDHSIEMREKLYPRLEFYDADGTYVLSVTGLEGADPFHTPLPRMDRDALPFTPLPDAGATPAEIDPEDPSARLFQECFDQGRTMRVAVSSWGSQQVWQGKLERAPILMGGCINMISKPFHLHLEAGKVARWQQDGQHLKALDPDGRLLGLELDLL